MFLESFKEQFLNTDLNRTDKWIEFFAKNMTHSYSIHTNLRRRLTDSSSYANVSPQPEPVVEQKSITQNREAIL
jgi:hypothetical protein